MEEVYIEDVTQGIKSAVNQIFTQIEEKNQPILKKSKKVYIKVNGIDFKKHTYTSPKVLESVIQYLKKKGAEIFVMENSTQGNLTRIVFEITGYREICEKNGVEIIYLDEEPTKLFDFKYQPSSEEDSKGYNLRTFRLPETIAYIINNRDSITYINIPKLKTHSMTVVTLGIKNQWGFPQHEDRGKDHNYNLHSKLVEVYELIKPDICLIDGSEGGLIHGHYPPTAWEDELIIPFNIIIGGRDTLAVDIVGARVFGLKIDEVPHLKLAHERGLGQGDISKIKIIGKDINEYKVKYEWNLLQKFPKDVKLIKGKTLLCKEGCLNNPLAFLQTIAFDYPEKFKGGWFLIMGKGHDEDLVDQLKKEGYTKGLVAGFCAVDEVGQKLRKEFGRRKIFFSHDCNNLADTITAELKLSSMSALDLVRDLSPEQIMEFIQEAKKHGTTALITTAF